MYLNGDILIILMKLLEKIKFNQPINTQIHYTTQAKQYYKLCGEVESINEKYPFLISPMQSSVCKHVYLLFTFFKMKKFPRKSSNRAFF